MKYKIEKDGNIKINYFNKLFDDTDDMDIVEFWEERLDRMGHNYTVAYKEIGGKIYYTIFTDVRSINSCFQVDIEGNEDDL